MAIDGLFKKKKAPAGLDLPLVLQQKNRKTSALLSRYGRLEHFTTENLYLYFIKNPEIINRKKVDSLGRIGFSPIQFSRAVNFDLFSEIRDRYKKVGNYISDLLDGSAGAVSVTRMWNICVVSAVIFGMFLMTFIYRYLGEGVLAGRENGTKDKTAAVVAQNGSGLVLGESAEKSENSDSNSDDGKITAEYVARILADYQKQDEEDEHGMIKKEIKEMVKGYPIEKMIPYIAKQDKVVAAFLVGIAKKESDWGKRVPVLNGEDCYNYWGYRGIRKRMGSGGHTCFDSPEDAVKTVAKRLEFLVSNEKLNTPGKMVVAWKCGYDCSWDSESAVKKWASDVDLYFKKFNDLNS